MYSSTHTRQLLAACRQGSKVGVGARQEDGATAAARELVAAGDGFSRNAVFSNVERCACELLLSRLSEVGCS